MVGVSFSIIPVAEGAFAQMYANGFCPTAEDGTLLPCPDGRFLFPNVRQVLYVF